jgi:mannose-1-phosphate guanylyltransferase/mannose-6-phosphate isomerase
MKMKTFYPVVLAGGSGTRFWPLSRKDRPKQFLKVTEGGSFLQMTVRRLLKRSLPDNLFIVTNKVYKQQVITQIKEFKIPLRNILCEEKGKNTAPAVCWAAVVIKNICPDAIMGVFPSDHLILKEQKFLKALDAAIKASKSGALVTFGIKPTRPETGFGYLYLGRTIDSVGPVRDCKRFVEKPDLKNARKYLKSKDYFWNSGMFVWGCDTILSQFKQHLPKMYEKIYSASNNAAVCNIWHELKPGSIDYGILEKADRVVAVAAEDIGWSDLGSWDALAEHLNCDKNNNSFRGKIIDIGSRNTMMIGDKRIIASIGLNDLVIVDTPDALLICKKGQSQEVRKVVAKLSAELT